MANRLSSGRRSSVYGKSLGGAGTRGRRDDPRPLKEDAYKHKSISALIGYLTDNGYSQPISQKILVSVSWLSIVLVYVLNFPFIPCSISKHHREKISTTSYSFCLEILIPFIGIYSTLYLVLIKHVQNIFASV
jgi:hypothetical protein